MKKKLVSMAMVGLMSLGVVGISQTALASDDNIGFNFKIYAYGNNGKEAQGQYRQTTDVKNPWKVRLDSSGEGKGSISEFWLENSSASNVSPVLSVTQGKGAQYDNPYSSANQTTVWLTGQNNNFNSSTYDVSGIWDEETW